MKTTLDHKRLLILAIQALEAERNLIDQEIATLRGQQPRTRTAPAVAAPARKAHGGISAAGRKRLSELAKKRWAARKKLGKSTL